MSATAPPERPTRPPRPGLPRPVAALLGVLGVAAAVGAGQLVAGLLSPASAPVLAVGDVVIRFAPQPLVEFAKETFGTADKAVLLAGIGLVVAVLAGLAGLLARYREQPAVLVITVLGLLGGAAVVAAPSFSPLDLLSPVVAWGVGVGVFRWLHRRALPAFGELGRAGAAGRAGAGGRDGVAGRVGVAGRAGAGGPGPSRRRVLGWAAGVGALSLGAGATGLALGARGRGSRQAVAGQLARALPAVPAPPIPAGADFPDLATPPFLTPNPDFYRIDTALLVPALTAAGWSLRIHGMVERELTLGFADLLARPLVARPVTLTCVSNPVGGDLISTAVFVGVELRELLLEAGVRPGADQLLSISSDGWTAGTPVDVLLEPDRGALLAIGMNGEPLPPEHGFPVRMVVPGLYGYVSATKWLTDLELTTFGAVAAYWQQRGWARYGPIKTECRIDVPRRNDRVPAGRVTVAGIAWAQHTGIDRVQVRLDGGPWRDAELATDVSRDTWRLWRAEVDLTPGAHTVQCRATDRTGAVQTGESADVLPDGATGWPAITFTAG